MTTVFKNTLLSVPIEDWQVRQVVVFDWYDGPREGLCELEWPKCCVYFAVMEERPTEDDLDNRFFRLSEAPADAVEQVVAILNELGPLRRPTWIPIWKFQTEHARLVAERKLDNLLAHLKRTNLIVQTPDMIHFLRYKLDK